MLISRILLSCIALFTGISPYLADWNETHIFNPHWSPHAKFHNAQTMAFAVVLMLLALVFAWRRGGDQRTNIAVAGMLASMYWVTQGLAHFYPGVSYVDPEFAGRMGLQPMFGLTPQGLIDIIVIALTAGAIFLAWRFKPTPTT